MADPEALRQYKYSPSAHQPITNAQKAKVYSEVATPDLALSSLIEKWTEAGVSRNFT
jgi:hypothetical protein